MFLYLVGNGNIIWWKAGNIISLRHDVILFERIVCVYTGKHFISGRQNAAVRTAVAVIQKEEGVGTGGKGGVGGGDEVGGGGGG